MHQLVDKATSGSRSNKNDAGKDGSILHNLIQAQDNSEEKMSPEELRDEVNSIMTAGHETTANTLSWALYLLSKPENGNVVNKIVEEVQTVLGYRSQITYDDIERLVYCKAVFMETLRVYPTVPLFTRFAEKETRLGSFKIPANVFVISMLFF